MNLPETPTTQEPTPTQPPQQLTVPAQGGAVAGMDDLDMRRDVSLPKLQLVQPTSTMEGADTHLGQWYNTGTGEFKPALELAVVSVSVRRVLFKKEYDPNAKDGPLCASADGLAPMNEFVGKQVTPDEGKVPYTEISGPCETCPFNIPSRTAAGKFVPPPCSLTYTYNVFDAQDAMPSQLSLRGSASGEARKLNYLLTVLGYGSTVMVTAKKNTGARGVFYVPQFSPSGNDTPNGLLKLITKVAAGIHNADAAAGLRTEPGAVSMPTTVAAPAVVDEVDAAFGPGPSVDQDDIPF